MVRFIHRRDAGRQLAAALAIHSDLEDAIVFGLPRGGVPVAYEVAVSLTLPLDVLVVRKIGVPFQPELAMGAVSEDDVVVIDKEVLASTHVSPQEFAQVEARERAELARRVGAFRDGRAPKSLVGRTVVIVDDGMATGSTCRAACRVVRSRGAVRVILAVPVASARTVETFRGEADEVISLVMVEGAFSVGQSYQHFDETADEEVVECLSRALQRGPSFA